MLDSNSNQAGSTDEGINIKSNQKEIIITPDFVPMIRIIFWNSMGFFFFSFLIPYVTVQLLGASGTILGLTFSIQTM
ncbi:unnamed protein product, partial [marine sediment metagenome]